MADVYLSKQGLQQAQTSKYKLLFKKLPLNFLTHFRNTAYDNLLVLRMNL